MNVDPAAPIHLLKGSDEVLLGDALSHVLDTLIGTGDRSLMLDELGIEQHLDANGQAWLAALVDSAATPPFLTDRRVVVGRHCAVFSTKDSVAPLVEYLADPLPTTSLVVVWEKDPRPNHGGNRAAVPKSLVDAITRCGGIVIDTDPGSGKAQTQWIDDHLADAPVHLDAAARRLMVEHLGQDVNRLPGLLTTFEGVFGTGAKIGVAEIEPFLGEAGDVAPWDLTDAIDKGDVVSALEVLDRMLVGGARHPIQIMATLTNHYLRMAQVDDPDIRTEREAAEALGLKGSTFPAKKALDGARRLGSERLAEVVVLLAEADLDLRGGKAWPPETVMEVLVARLASRSRGAQRSRR